MLVLTRKLNEQIAIGEEITITVLRIKGNRVRIGVSAPEDVRVVRSELPRYSMAAEPETATSTKAVASEPESSDGRHASWGRESGIRAAGRPTGSRPLAGHMAGRSASALPEQSRRATQVAVLLTAPLK